MAEVKARVHSKTIDELFADAMSGIRSDFGNNPNARTSELAVGEMHRRLKLAFEAHGEIFVGGNDKPKECTCRMPTIYSSPEGAKGHCTCGAL